MNRVLAMLGDLRPWKKAWALDRGSAAELVACLLGQGTRLVVEAGSGSSTLLLGEWARATGGHVIALEHDPTWRDVTLSALKDRGLDEHVDLRYAPLRSTPDGPWYDADLPDGIQVVLVGGPPEREGGRGAALPCLLSHLAPGWRMFLHDAKCPGEARALTEWQARYGVAVDVRMQLAQVTAAPVTRPQVDGKDLAVTVLTGARPALLSATLASLDAAAPGLLGTAHVTVLHHSGDEATAGVLAGYGEVIDEVITRAEPPMIGRGWADLMASAVASGRRHVLHLEDDWATVTFSSGWLEQAAAVLDERPDIAQVRLRHCREWTLPTHMVTREPLEWAPDAGHGCIVAPDAHLTFNPALRRAVDVAAVLGVGAGDIEKDVQRVAHGLGFRGAAQALPGVFAHIGGVTGGSQSVRHRTACADKGVRR